MLGAEHSWYPCHVVRTYRYRFYPTDSQEEFLARTIGCCRFVYNRALEEREAAWGNGEASLGYGAQSARLTRWKRAPETAFLADVSAAPLQQALRHLDTAYTNFFRKRANKPTFKKRRHGGSAEFTRKAFTLAGAVLRLGKMDAPLAVRWSRPLPAGARPTTVTVSRDASSRWHVAIRFDAAPVKCLRKSSKVVGVDLGVTTFATLSTGERVDNPRHGRALLARRQRLSRELSRKERGSRNWEKARLRLSRLLARAADQRRDFLHKLSTRLVRENQAIAVETLNVEGMRKMRPLAQSIAEAGWHELTRQLAYKCEWYGRTLVKIGRFVPSTRTCSECGLIRGPVPLQARTWRCECGAEHDRDHNAAKNILAAGLAATACGVDVRRRALRDAAQSATKQEP